jgi:hypothetical protein
MKRAVRSAMDAELISDLFVLVCTAVGFIYGTRVFLTTRAPLYTKMITGAVGCSMLGRLLVVIHDLLGTFGSGFRFSVLGCVGAFLFLFTANAGLMDELADDGNARYAKYRRMSLWAPVVAFLLDVPIVLSASPVTVKVSYVVASLVIAAASFFNLKHAMFSNAEFGVVSCVSDYNLCALAYAFLHMDEMVALSFDATIAVVATRFFVGIVSLLIPIMLKKGIDKWQM